MRTYKVSHSGEQAIPSVQRALLICGPLISSHIMVAHSGLSEGEFALMNKSHIAALPTSIKTIPYAR